MDLMAFLEEFLKFLEGKSEKNQIIKKKSTEFFNKVKYNTFVVGFLIIFLMVSAIFLSPIFVSSNNPGLRGIGMITMVLSGVMQVCHQLPYRSFTINGIQQAVCARDIGIYLGFVAGLSLVFIKNTPKIFKKKRILLYSIIPIMLDGVTQTILALRESNNIIRFVTGFIFSLGWMGFITKRYINKRVPELRKYVDKETLIVDFIIILFLISFSFEFFNPLGFIFMSRNQAINQVVTDPSEIDYSVHYIPPNTPFSISLDPFYKEHESNLFSDVRNMSWVEKHLQFSNSMYNLNLTAGQLLYGINESTISTENLTKHRLGMWVVQIDKDGIQKYVYLDAFSNEVITETIH